MGGMTLNIEAEGDDDRANRRSKSDRKREAASLQELGVELAALAPAEIEALGLPEKLVGALLELRRLTAHGAQVRQRQYIGKLMRSIDPAPLRARLEARKQRHDADIRRFQRVERWRDRLLDDPAAGLAELLEEHPHADRRALTTLVDKAQTERLRGRTPAAARALFDLLRRLLE
jgi:ribosome-associated protein